jgi:GAF domain-containing protein
MLASALGWVPLVKGDRFVAALGVHQHAPRGWTPEEVALVEETAERAREEVAVAEETENGVATALRTFLETTVSDGVDAHFSFSATNRWLPTTSECKST